MEHKDNGLSQPPILDKSENEPILGGAAGEGMSFEVNKTMMNEFLKNQGKLNWFNVLGWVAACLSICATWCLANQILAGFFLFLIANTLLTARFFKVKDWSQVAMLTVLSCINISGIINWSN